MNLQTRHLMLKKKKKDLVNKLYISGFINDSDVNKKIETLATQAELKAELDRIVKLYIHVLIFFSR